MKGEASQRIKSVCVNKPETYDTMWKTLEDYYDDTYATVQVTLVGSLVVETSGFTSSVPCSSSVWIVV